MREKPKAYYETDEFLKLQKQWYGKLKKEGFDDVEFTVGGESGNLLKGPNAMTLIRMGPIRTVGRERFYELARQWLWYLRKQRANARSRRNRGTVETPLEEIQVWALYSEGHSPAAIHREGGIEGLTIYQVQGVVNRQRKKMFHHLQNGLAPFDDRGEPEHDRSISTGVGYRPQQAARGHRRYGGED